MPSTLLFAAGLGDLLLAACDRPPRQAAPGEDEAGHRVDDQAEAHGGADRLLRGDVGRLPLLAVAYEVGIEQRLQVVATQQSVGGGHRAQRGPDAFRSSLGIGQQAHQAVP